jgi:hypothetical protein
MNLAERRVVVPMFINPNPQVNREMMNLAMTHRAQEGDVLTAEFIGTTKDSDGWPMSIFMLRIERNSE